MDIRTEADPDPGSRALGVLAGIWLVASGFLWPHALEQAILAWSIGGLMIVASLAPSPAGLIDAALAAILVIGTLVLPHHMAVTIASNVAVAIVSLAGASIPLATWRYQHRTTVA